MRGIYGALASLAGLMLTMPAQASEAGGGVYSNGAEGSLAGHCRPRGSIISAICNIMRLIASTTARAMPGCCPISR